MTIFRASIITTLQPPEEKQIIPVYNDVGTQRATLKNISIKRGTETYKLHKPNGRKEGIRKMVINIIHRPTIQIHTKTFCIVKLFPLPPLV
jgi:hypothetical protein